jgi:uncharacterized membrane protein
MKLNAYRFLFATVGLIGVLLISIPSLETAIRIPEGEQFSELYLLGPKQTADDYPFNIAAIQNYSIYVGVGNNLGSSTYYLLKIKLQNQTDLMPNANSGEPSPIQTLYEYHLSIQNHQSSRLPLTFAVSEVSTTLNQTLISKLTINGDVFNVDKPAAWDANNAMFTYNLVIELWLYNPQSNSFLYNNRFVFLPLNFTAQGIPT